VSPGGGTPVADALDGAVTAITAGGSQTPRLDAEVLLAHVLGVKRERLLSERELSVRGPAVRAYQDAVRRRAIEREPVAYIIGSKGFRNLELVLDRRALIPRPETELLVEIGLGLPDGANVLDACTGSGAVALALKDERPDLQLTGSDLSAEALDLAAENGRRLDLEVRWQRADLLDGLPDEFEAVLANPPYVAEVERAVLAPEILRHEPPAALFAGPDGLSVISRLTVQLGRRPRVALAAVEVGAGQADAVVALFGEAGFGRVRVEVDLQGIKRVVIGERG
jgi:release factor glutamine methyltransferase